MTSPTAPRRARSVSSLAAALLVCAAACGHADAAPDAWSSPSIDRFVRWEGSFRLEENDDVVNVWPVPHLDPRGGFLVADTRERQARRYDASGHLLLHFGRRGKGPGEFEGPVSTLRLPSGELAVADLSGTVAVFDSTGSTLLRTWQTGLLPLYDAEVLDGSRLVLVGRGPAITGPLLHLFDLRTGRMLRHFFAPPPAPGLSRRGALTAAFAEATVRGDTIAVVHSLIDTLFVFRADGTPLRRIALPLQHFRLLERDYPRNATREQGFAWTSSFSLLSHAFWAGDGSWLVQYQDRDGPEIHWRLLRMTGDGRRLFELRDTPQLLATDPASGRLFFVDPRSPAPDTWSAARLVSR